MRVIVKRMSEEDPVRKGERESWYVLKAGKMCYVVGYS